MRRSSWLAIGIALLILAGLVIVLPLSVDARAPRMTPGVANEIIDRGKRALQAGDADGIIDLMAPNARILDQTPEQIRLVLSKTIRELGSSKLEIKRTPPVINEQHGTAYVSFDLDVGERRGNVEIRYYHTRLSMQLEKVAVREWLGLRRAERWRIVRLDSSESLDVPPP